jgi:RND family efflux transporter MFP subunit
MAAKALSRILIVGGILVLIVAAAVAFHLRRAAMNHPERTALEPPGAAKAPQKVMYHCPMHPNYISDKPGTCPICGMELVPFIPSETEQAQPQVPDHAAITLSPERRQLIGVQTGLVEKKRVTKTIRAAARVEYDEKRLATVNLKYGGWVEELMVKSVGETVRKGAPLMALYSPDLLEAQRNYLIARAAVAALGKDASADSKSLADETLRSAKERLLLWDVTEEQLKAIETSGQPEHNVTVFSKANGVVTARNVTLGAAVEPGRNLFEIADLSTVWVTADVYEYEAPLVKTGQEAKVALVSSPSEPLTGVVSYIYPYLNEPTRTLRVRVECPNPDSRLKPGMYATVSIAADLGEQLVVDDDAIVNTGLRQIVFVDEGEGRLEPREVTIAERADGRAVVAKGLSEGERVVTSGNFLVDSESRMEAALRQSSAAMSGHEAHEGMKMGETAQPPEKAEKGSSSGMPPMPGM